MKIYFLKLLYQILFTKIDEEPLNVAANFNKTTILGGAMGVRTPTQLNGLGETLINHEERGRIEINQPKSKIVLSANYQI